jgi:hypothetical protein
MGYFDSRLLEAYDYSEFYTPSVFYAFSNEKTLDYRFDNQAFFVSRPSLYSTYVRQFNNFIVQKFENRFPF